jgi:hypothetical protein
VGTYIEVPVILPWKQLYTFSPTIKLLYLVAQMYKEIALPDVGNFVSKDTYITQSSSVQSRYIKHKIMVAQMYKETTLPDISNFMSKDTYITQSSSVQSRYIKHKTMSSYSAIQRNSIAR